MRCDALNGYANWLVRDSVTSERIEGVLWVDPEQKTYCKLELPLRRLPNGQPATRELHASLVIVAGFVAGRPLLLPTQAQRRHSQRRLGQPEGAGRQVNECRQDQACRRTHYCARYRCGFGEVDKP